MFVDELVKDFFEYKKDQVTRLKQKKERALDAINQSVSIRDIVVRGKPPNCYGESKENTNTYLQPQEERINAQIQFLFNLAVNDHRASYCQKQGQQFKLKKGNENKVTRLTMNEFSFYTKKPLTMEEFTQMVKNIEKMAETLDPNVHVLLSSFAVKEGPNLINMSIFVEGGKPPTIHSFAKNSASGADIAYEKRSELYSQQKTQGEDNFHADAALGDKGQSVAMGSVFEVKTEGGASYTQAVDICLDHLFGHSKKLLQRRIKDSEQEILPEQIEHVVTSNWIDMRNQSTLSTQATHADPIRSMVSFYKHEVDSHTLSNAEKEAVIPREYNRLEILDQNYGYLIINPPFGSDFKVELVKERPAGRYISSLEPDIKAHNGRAIKDYAKQRLQSPEQKIIYQIKEGNAVEKRIAELEQTLLKHCRPSLLQRLFKTEEYQQKLEAKTIIENSMKTIKETAEKHGDAAIFIIRGWKKDLAFKLNRIGSNSADSSFKQMLKEDIRTIIDDKLQKDLQCEFEEPEKDNYKDGEYIF